MTTIYISRIDYETLERRGRCTLTAYNEPVGDASNEVALVKAASGAGEPVYQVLSEGGKWIDQSQESYEYNRSNGWDVRVLYTTPPAAVALTAPLIARSLSEWHEDDRVACWWAWNGHGWAGEPPWIGTPNDDDWPGYHTHWTPAPDAPVTGIVAQKGGDL